jgi:hypothetical protein
MWLLRRQFAWAPREGGLWVAMTLLAAAGLGLSWWRLSGEAHTDQQIGPTVSAILTFVAAGVVHLHLVTRGRRQVRRRARRLLGAGLLEGTTAPEPSVRLVAVVSLKRFHFIDCPLVEGRPARAASRAQHLAAGRQPCGICGSGSDPDA